MTILAADADTLWLRVCCHGFHWGAIVTRSDRYHTSHNSTHAYLQLLGLLFVQAQEDGHAFVAPTRVRKAKFKSGISADKTVRLEKPKNNLDRRRLLALQ